MKANELEPGFYWFLEKDEPPKVVWVNNTYRNLPVEPRLEVYFPGNELGFAPDECRGIFLGPLMVPIQEKYPEGREKMTEWVKTKVNELLADPTCEVKISRDLSKFQEEIHDEDNWVLPAKQQLVIGVEGGGKP